MRCAHVKRMNQPTDAKVPHEWESITVKGLPVSCHQCSKNAMAIFKCKACGYLLHKECLAKVGYQSQTCTKQPYVPEKKEKKEEMTEEKKEKRSFSGILGRKKERVTSDELKPLAPTPAAAGAPAAPTAQTADVVKEQHTFDVANLSRPTYCDLCKNFIWGLAKQAFRCKVCQFTIHKKCLIKVPTTHKCVTDQTELVKKLEQLQEQLKRAESATVMKPPAATAPTASTAEGMPKVENLEISNKPSPTAPTTSGGGAPDSDDEDEDMCVICWQEKINTVLLECGHRCVCLGCSAGMENGKLCPICRSPVVRVVRIYDAH